MSIRNLTTTQRPNGNVHREFNHLRISNLDDFLDSMGNYFEPYRAPFEILAELENKVKFMNEPDETVLIAYKDDGDCIFDLVELKLGVDGRRVIVYEYTTTIS